jgi:hypothetical protein
MMTFGTDTPRYRRRNQPREIDDRAHRPPSAPGVLVVRPLNPQVESPGRDEPATEVSDTRHRAGPP